MDPLFLILLLIAAAALLLVGDLFLPSGGIMSVLGVGMLLTAVIVCFTINRWLGLGVLFGGVVASPFVATGMVRAWQRTPTGRRMVLTHSAPTPPPPVIGVGAVGTTLSALRPMGECEFHVPAAHGTAEIVIECRSEFGELPAGTPVRVTHYKDGLATVRPIQTPAHP